MFERLTDRARKVVVLAQDQARELKHDYVGTEHLLLGLLEEGEGVGPKVLLDLGVEKSVVRTRILELVKEGTLPPSVHISFNSRAKKVLELSLREALQLGHSYIGTEHILLGLIREGQGLAVGVLNEIYGEKFDLEDVRKAVLQFLKDSGLESQRMRKRVLRDGELLTLAEHMVVDLAGRLWDAMCEAIPEGPSRDRDLEDLVPHIHAIQHAFMAQAAGRRYPNLYRLLGKSFRGGDTDDEPIEKPAGGADQAPVPGEPE